MGEQAGDAMVQVCSECRHSTYDGGFDVCTRQGGPDIERAVDAAGRHWHCPRGPHNCGRWKANVGLRQARALEELARFTQVLRSRVDQAVSSLVWIARAARRLAPQESGPPTVMSTAGPPVAGDVEIAKEENPPCTCGVGMKAGEHLIWCPVRQSELPLDEGLPPGGIVLSTDTESEEEVEVNPDQVMDPEYTPPLVPEHDPTEAPTVSERLPIPCPVCHRTKGQEGSWNKSPWGEEDKERCQGCGRVVDDV